MFDKVQGIEKSFNVIRMKAIELKVEILKYFIEEGDKRKGDKCKVVQLVDMDEGTYHYFGGPESVFDFDINNNYLLEIVKVVPKSINGYCVVFYQMVSDKDLYEEI